MTAESPSSSREIRLSQIVGGSLLVIVGTAWLLEVLDVVDVSWRVLLAAALIVVGAALAWGSRIGRQGGLIAIGVILAVGVVFASTLEVLLDVRFSGGVGERAIGADDVDGRRLAIGTLTVDLRGDELEGDVEVSVGIGEAVVIVDDQSAVVVEARAGIGEVVVFGRRSGGLGAALEVEGGSARYRLIVSVGIGKVEVRT